MCSQYVWVLNVVMSYRQYVQWHSLSQGSWWQWVLTQSASDSIQLHQYLTMAGQSQPSFEAVTVSL